MIQSSSGQIYINGKPINGVVSVDISTQKDFSGYSYFKLNEGYSGTMEVEFSDDFKRFIEHNKLVYKIERDIYYFWKEQGLTDEQIEKLSTLELEEFSQLHPFQEWSSRKSLLENNIITLDEVLTDINATT